MPWLGYLDKMDRCDVFVFLDNVQYKKNEYQNRNRIKTSHGWQWLTVPTHYKFPQKINEVPVDNGNNWPAKHLNSLRANYGKSPYFKKYMEHFTAFYEQDWRLLSEVNMASVILLKELFAIKSETVIASEMEGLSDEPSQRLVDICAGLGADTYLAGTDGIKYMDVNIFRDAGINVIFQEFHHPVYKQMFNDFEYFMSAIDLIFNCGEKGMDIIRKEAADEFTCNRSAS
jgi:hypothetical protein